MIRSIGRRKRSVARLILEEGSGKFEINGREGQDYLNNEVLMLKVNRPFDVIEKKRKNFDLRVKVSGGGPSGQAEALRLAISRALIQWDPELRPALKAEKLLTVDDRQVERKKYGKKKARKSTQFSKR